MAYIIKRVGNTLQFLHLGMQKKRKKGAIIALFHLSTNKNGFTFTKPSCYPLYLEKLWQFL